MMPTKQTEIRATYMRGGTSKGVFFLLSDLPASLRMPSPQRDAVLMRIIGAPDPYGTQIDGMGGATSSTSKVVLISPSDRPDCDVDYLFGAVSLDRAVIDWSGNCGNLSAAVGPFAVARGLVDAPGDGTATVRIWQANIGKRIVAQVPMAQGVVAEMGEFRLDGVGFPAAEVVLAFLDPGAADGGMFPTGQAVEVIDVPDVGPVQATLLNVGNAAVFVEAQALGLTGLEGRDQVEGDPALMARLEYIRAESAVRMGLCADREAATTTRQHTPKVAYVFPPRPYVATDGRKVSASQYDLGVRILSMGRLHHAITATGAVGVASAAALAGNVVSRQLSGGGQAQVRIGHRAGVLPIGATVRQGTGGWVVERVVMSRSARRLMDGVVFVPDTVLYGALPTPDR